VERPDSLVEVQVSDVVERRRSNVSNMPNGVINVLQKNEVLDLLAYILSNANPDDPRFKAAD
jgi:hypothetical protein